MASIGCGGIDWCCQFAIGSVKLGVQALSVMDDISDGFVYLATGIEPHNDFVQCVEGLDAIAEEVHNFYKDLAPDDEVFSNTEVVANIAMLTKGATDLIKGLPRMFNGATAEQVKGAMQGINSSSNITMQANGTMAASQGKSIAGILEGLGIIVKDIKGILEIATVSEIEIESEVAIESDATLEIAGAAAGSLTGGGLPPDDKKKSDNVQRIKQIEVEFNYKTKYDKTEFTRQLADQEVGMNQLTVDEYLKNRERYLAEGRAVEGNMAQKATREKALVDKVDELRSSGMSLKEAETQAQKWLDTQAALHNPDQIAGGNPLKIGGMGDSAINSSIGSQWKYRIDAIDEQIQAMAKNMTDAERKNTYLNVKLKY